MTIRVLILLLLCNSLHAANYFVDYVAGADTNAGTSTGAAWKRCPGDPQATNTAASATLAAGDTVFFKGGVTYVLAGATGISVNWSGTNGSPITYDGNSAGTWGTGRAIMTDSYGGNNVGAFFSTSSRSYVTFNYFQFQNIGGTAVLPTDTGSAVAERPGTACAFGNGSVGLVFSNNTINGMGYIFNQKPMDRFSVNGTGIVLYNPSGAQVFNNDFTRCYNAVYIGYSGTGTTASSVYNNTIHNYIHWGITIVPLGTSGINIPANSVYGNLIYDYPEWSAAQWTGYGDWPHVDGMFLFNNNSTDNITWSAQKIYKNKFYQTPGNFGDGSGMLSISEGPDVDVFNNLFVYAGQNGRTVYIHNTGTTHHSQAIRFLNNTFLGVGAQCLNFESGVGVFANLAFTAKNNIFSNLTAANNSYVYFGDYSGTLGTWTFNYNLYDSANTFNAGTWGGTQGSDFMSNFGGVGEGGITQMRANGWEANGDSNSMGLVSITSDASTCNLHLLSSSAARNTGQDLTSLGITELNSDYDGIARPSGSAWDIGAYQYVAAGGAGGSTMTGKITITGKATIK